MKRYGLDIPHNRIHAILNESGRALPETAKQRRRKWVRYEMEHSMSLWHTDWYELSDGRWWISVKSILYLPLLLLRARELVGC